MAKSKSEYITEGWQLFAEGKPRPSELAAVSWQSRAILQGWDEASQNAQDEAAVKKSTVLQNFSRSMRAPKVQRDLNRKCEAIRARHAHHTHLRSLDKKPVKSRQQSIRESLGLGPMKRGRAPRHMSRDTD